VKVEETTDQDKYQEPDLKEITEEDSDSKDEGYIPYKEEVFEQVKKVVAKSTPNDDAAASVGALYARIAARVGQIAPNDLTLSKELGKGAYGVVHLGRMHTTVVAVKTLKVALLEKEPKEKQIALWRAFLGELRICAILKKKFPQQGELRSTPLMGVQLKDGVFYGAFEFAGKGELTGKLAKLSKVTKMVAVLQVAKALEQLHSVRILHLDVAPRNVLIYKQPNGQLQFKLADFGMAQKLPVGKTWATHHTNQPPPQAAPETLTSIRCVGTFTDIWQFGLLVVHILDEEQLAASQLWKSGKFDVEATTGMVKDIICGKVQYKIAKLTSAIPKELAAFEKVFEACFWFKADRAWFGKQPKPERDLLIKEIAEHRPTAKKIAEVLSGGIAPLAAAERK
jgi:serine/threonine protein kinase